ncbi:MAG: hypothetical protein ACIAQF_09430 [Phycisphaerales bacterium JB065]
MTESHEHYRESDPTKDPHITRCLSQDEQVVWVGRPSQRYLRRRAWRSCLGAVPGVLFLSGFAFFFSYYFRMPLSTKDKVLMYFIFGVLFTFQFLLLIAPLWYPWRFSGTRYAITRNRCLVLGPLPGSHTLHGRRSVRSWYREDLQSLKREEDRKGSGHLRFERIAGRDRAAAGGTAARRSQDAFMGLDDPAQVERLIRQSLFRSPSEEADL